MSWAGTAFLSMSYSAGVISYLPYFETWNRLFKSLGSTLRLPVATSHRERSEVFTTANRARVEPFHYQCRNDTSAPADSVTRSRVFVSPRYLIYLFSFDQCANSQSLLVPNSRMKVHLLRSAQCLRQRRIILENGVQHTWVE